MRGAGGRASHPNKGKPQSAEALAAHARKDGPPPTATGDLDVAAHWREVQRRNAADARIKELRARKLEVDALEREGQLIRAELVGEWTRKLLQQHRAALDAADALVDLRGHDPELAASLRKILGEIISRLRHNIAYAPAMGTPPPTIQQEGDHAA